jgi:hypothetical protein
MSSQNIWPTYFYNFQNTVQSKKNNPMGENLLNLVTLPLFFQRFVQEIIL